MTIKEIREVKGLTQSELAAALGTTQAMVSRWEKGQTRPGVESLRKIAALAECGMEDIAAATPRPRNPGKEDQRRAAAFELACQLSGIGSDPAACSAVRELIPASWWSAFSVQHLADVLAVTKKAYDAGCRA